MTCISEEQVTNFRNQIQNNNNKKTNINRRGLEKTIKQYSTKQLMETTHSFISKVYLFSTYWINKLFNQNLLFHFFTIIFNNHRLVFALVGCVAWLKPTAGKVSSESSDSDGGFNALLLVCGISTNFSISGINNGLRGKMPVYFKQLNFFLHNGDLSTFDKHEKHPR